MAEDPRGLTLEHARAVARRAHDGQVDELGVAAIEHAEAVADALAGFDPEVQVAGVLHAVVDDSTLTPLQLREAGVSDRSLAAIEPRCPRRAAHDARTVGGGDRVVGGDHAEGVLVARVVGERRGVGAAH
ncbi:hypothetical protein, partial [Nocardioides sp. YIM 152588]|uniref:hypothetical protein n=1 Tax=Nocardioides sp. YIM 152588 TaxID=3158259 RepID=UPI0032E3F738